MNRLGKSLPPLASLLPFEAAARLGSFSRAADELHLTQAAVSRQILALEQDLGVRLFERRNRGVFLSAAGQEFHMTLGNALRSIAADADRLRGVATDNEVVLLCQLSEAFHWLMPRLSSFHQRCPEVALKLATTTRPLVEFEGHFDLALQSSNRDSGLHPLLFTASDEVFPVCSPAYLKRHGGRVEPGRLGGHVLLHHHARPPYQLEGDTWLAAAGHALPADARGLVFDSYALTLQAAVEGHGLAIGWRRTSGRMIENGTLVAPCNESIRLPEAIAVHRRHGLIERPELARFVEWLREELAGPD